MKQPVRVAIVASEYHKEMVEAMITSCTATLSEHKVNQVEVFFVPGAFEIPLTVKKIAVTGRFDCFIAFGVVIKGDTLHFELIAEGCTQGIMDVMLETGVPIIHEVLAVNKKEDAQLRSQGKLDKGREAALSAISLLQLYFKHHLT